ncbi:MAG: DUF1353 domain-containing protein [Hoeflea sp.]|uniref:DUF1353 domain-containing protein n=1 Tax=Hoeflea sp. TaxID=1940281 RepID=UPI003EF3472A
MPRTAAILAGIVFATLSSNVARADFTGTLILLPPGCENTGFCKLGDNFGFVDSGNTGWEAAKGLLTDGASIPPWAQPLVGAPFEKSFIKAAIIHDHYCDRHVRPWRQTHKVFHEALLKSGVTPGKAGIMYFAVMIGGPKWAKLIKGKPCSVGGDCINQVDVTSAVPGGGLTIGSEGEVFVSRPDTYASAWFANTLAANLPDLKLKGDALTAEEVEAMAAKAMVDDFYFKHEDTIGTEMSIDLKIEP